MKKIVFLFSLLLLLFVSGAWAQADKLPAAALKNFNNQATALKERKSAFTPTQKKINPAIVLYLHESVLKDAAPVLPNVRHGVVLNAANEIVVDIKAQVSEALLTEIKNNGGTIINAFPQYHAIRARLPITAVEKIAARPEVIFIDKEAAGSPDKVNTSEGDVAHNGPLVRALHYTGAGVKVGVMSDSVDYLSQVQASGDLPPNVTVLQNAPGNAGEGTAMLEIVHDLAPDATLYFATATGGTANFANNILALQQAGCKVIADDYNYATESPFQDDIIAQAVTTVTNAGVVYCGSSGNRGNKHSNATGTWEGDYVDSNSTTPVPNAHDFGGGVITNRITANPAWIALFWSDPLGGAANDYDLFVVDAGGNIIAYSDDVQDGTQDPFEYIPVGNFPVDYTNYYIAIQRYAGSPRFLHLVAWNGTLNIGTNGATMGHKTVDKAFCVAAVSAYHRTTAFTGTEAVETFSSDGPRRIFYKADGTPITPGNVTSTGGQVRAKPDFAAADGVACATPNPAFNPFYGTSAAAPHAAGIAALLLSARPNASLAALKNALTKSALPAPSLWHDYSGYGIIMADLGLHALGSPAISSIVPILLGD